MFAILVRSLATCILLLISCVPLGRDKTMNIPEADPAMVDEEIPLDQFTGSFEDAYNTHDPLLVADLYAADARWMAAAGLVIEGRPLITTFLQQFMTIVPPMLTLTEGDNVVVGDFAVTHGTYTMSDGPNGAGRSIGGSYMNVLRIDGDAWRITHQQMNYDFEMLPLMWVGSLDAVKVLAEDGSLVDLTKAYEAGYNTGDPAVVAALFTDDAWGSFGGSAPVTGRDAVTQALKAWVADERQLTLYEVSTLLLDEGTAVDVGWFELKAGDDRVQWGTYSLLARKNAEGDFQIHWFIDTGSPLSINAP